MFNDILKMNAVEMKSKAEELRKQTEEIVYGDSVCIFNSEIAERVAMLITENKIAKNERERTERFFREHTKKGGRR